MSGPINRPGAYAVGLAFVAVVVIANLLFQLLGEPEAGLRSSSLGTSPVGHKAYFELLNEAGFSPGRNQALPSRVAEQKGVLFLIEPSAHLLRRDSAYLEELDPWISKGNTLLLALSCSPCLKEMNAYGHAFDALGIEVSLAGATASDATAMLSERPLDPIEHPIGRHCERLALEHSCWFEGRGVEAADHVVDLDEKPFVVESRRGEGRIVLVADGSFFRNGRILEGDNGVFAYNLAFRYGTAGVVFDEFYHGLYRSPNIVWLILAFPNNVVAAALILSVLVFVLSRFRQFGPPIPDTDPSRRSRAEYVYAMAELYRRGGRTRMSLGQLVAGLTREIGQAYRLRDLEDPVTVLKGLRARSCAEADEIGRSLQRIWKALASGRRLSEREMLRLYEDLWCQTRKAIDATNQGAVREIRL